MKITSYLLRGAFCAFAFCSARGNAATSAVGGSPTRELLVEWTHDGAPEYRVYELTAPDTWAVVTSVTAAPGEASAPRSTSLMGVAPGVHTYRITAVGPWGESPPSTSVSTPGASDAPTNPRVKIILQLTVNLP